MIRFVTAAGDELTLPGQDLDVEIASPYFGTDVIPGVSTYPFNLPATGDNPRALGWPHLYRGPGGPPPVATDCYVDGPRWKRGSLVYRGHDVDRRTYRYTFVADATDLARDLAALRLPAVTLADAVFGHDGPVQDGYVLAPVRNAAFFDKKNPAFLGILNRPTPGGVLGPAGPAQVYVPMFYLVPIVRQVLATLGWEAVGAFLDDAEMQTAVIYSDRALPATQGVGSLFSPARHLPDVSVAELLLGLQNLFCLGIYFNPATRQVRFTPLREAVRRGAYVDRPGATRRRSEANATKGFTLRLAPDTNDELDKTLDTSWQQLVLGAGQEAITVGAGTLHMVREEDPVVASRRWLVPAISATGAAAEFELGDDSRTGLRLLFDRGLQFDSQGNPYALLSAGTEDYAGAPVGQYSLHWAGPQGLYETWHRPWLDFRTRAVASEYAVPFRIADLCALDPGLHELVDGHLLLWEKVRVKLSAGGRLRTATISYQELL